MAISEGSSVDPFDAFSAPVGKSKGGPQPVQDETFIGSSAPAHDPFDQFSTTISETPAFSEKVSTFAQGANRAVFESTTALSGAIAGGQIGMTVGAATGPAAPLAVPIFGVTGAAVGAFAGFMAGDELADQLTSVRLPGASESLTFDSLESVPMDLRPYAIAGETLGAATAFAGVPFSLGRVGVKYAPDISSRVLGTLIDNARKAPAMVAQAELQMAVGASIGGGVAQEISPGDPWMRFGGELIGGMSNPGRWIAGSVNNVWRMGKNFIASRSRSMQESQAADYLNTLLDAGGEGVDAVVAALRQRDDILNGVKLTPGQKTGSPTLLHLEAKLANLSSEYGADSRRAAEEGLRTMRAMIQGFNEVGTPEALRLAVQTRSAYFDTLLETRLQSAEESLIEAAGKINFGDELSRAQFGIEANAVIDDAMSSVRTIERELWDQVDQNVRSEADNLFSVYESIRTEKRLPTERLPSTIERHMADLRARREQISQAAQAGETDIPPLTTSRELMLFRSRMLALSREAAADNKWSDANAYGRLAEAALDDLDSLPGFVDEGGAYDAAREWSRKLHETFSRTFAGDVLNRTDEGGLRLPPELVMVRAFGQGREVGDLQFRHLEEAAALASSEHLSKMLDLQERTLRFAAADLVQYRVNPRTGKRSIKVDADKLATFTQRNAELLKRFPELEANLKDTESAAMFFARTEARNNMVRSRIESQAALSKMLQTENPSRAIGEMLNGPNPVRDLRTLAGLARNNSPEAVEGMQAAVHGLLFQRATRADGSFSFDVYRQNFEGPVAPNGPTLKETLIEAGVMTRERADLVSEFFERAAQIENAITRREPLDDFLKEEQGVFDFALRIIGARMASELPTGGAHALIVQSAGSRLSRQLFDKVPRGKTRDIITEAMRPGNEEFLATLLEKGGSYAQKLERIRKLNAFLWSSGVVNGWEAGEDVLEEMALPEEVPETTREITPLQ